MRLMTDHGEIEQSPLMVKFLGGIEKTVSAIADSRASLMEYAIGDAIRDGATIDDCLISTTRAKSGVSRDVLSVRGRPVYEVITTITAGGYSVTADRIKETP
jgi:hypothetical protein